MASNYNYVFSGTKTIAKAGQTTEASGQAGMADRVGALQAEVDDLEQDINVINGPTGLGARQSDDRNSSVSAQIHAIQNAIQELQEKQERLCNAVTAGSIVRDSVCK